jgi:isoleucyl-tRNA synthetase
LGCHQISELEKSNAYTLSIDGVQYPLDREDVEIISEDIPGWLVSTDDTITVALDIQISEELLAEGYAKELINRIQNIRKQKDFVVTDRISVVLQPHENIYKALASNKEMISQEVLAEFIDIREGLYEETFEWDGDTLIGYTILQV